LYEERKDSHALISGDLIIGGGGNSSRTNFRGLIKDVRIWNSALDPQHLSLNIRYRPDMHPPRRKDKSVKASSKERSVEAEHGSHLRDNVEMNALRRRMATSAERRAFDLFDRNGNGFIEVTEIDSALQHLKVVIPKDELLQQIARADKNKTGEIDFKEFSQMLEELQYVQQISGVMKSDEQALEVSPSHVKNTVLEMLPLPPLEMLPPLDPLPPLTSLPSRQALPPVPELPALEPLPAVDPLPDFHSHSSVDSRGAVTMLPPDMKHQSVLFCDGVPPECDYVPPTPVPFTVRFEEELKRPGNKQMEWRFPEAAAAVLAAFASGGVETVPGADEEELGQVSDRFEVGYKVEAADGTQSSVVEGSENASQSFQRALNEASELRAKILSQSYQTIETAFDNEINRAAEARAVQLHRSIHGGAQLDEWVGGDVRVGSVADTVAALQHLGLSFETSERVLADDAESCASDTTVESESEEEWIDSTDDEGEGAEPVDDGQRSVKNDDIKEGFLQILKYNNMSPKQFFAYYTGGEHKTMSDEVFVKAVKDMRLEKFGESSLRHFFQTMSRGTSSVTCGQWNSMLTSNTIFT